MPIHPDWRPMDTAPKDGTHILTLDMDEETIEITEWYRLEHDHYEPIAGTDTFRKERRVYAEGWNNNGHRAIGWQPLPPVRAPGDQTQRPSP